uniref:Reverse transcriptase domain-containing protein n=1 Tax=Tanacetum cinerariifolium TaxID=118510 RepID=A0A6L2LC93_TANCI|nr:hypothetical protein [Tanacetum cinerariifolium]
MHQSEESKALYGVTSPRDYAVTSYNEEISHHTLYDIKSLQDYAVTFKSTREDVADSALRRLENPRSVNMIIEMADRSMQSPKGIVENVLVKIHKFFFSVDFVILDIIEDNKVPIILGRPMLATIHARIYIFRGKFSLEVGKEQVIFNANEGATPVTVLPVCVIKIFDVIDDINRPDDSEEFLMDDNLHGDLENFL